MAGHSKWANTKFRKAAQDQKRGKLFTKLIREITIATKQQGADPNLNPRLRGAIDKALTANLTKDAIERAIKRALGNEEKSLIEVGYEGYGPYGIAVMVDCLTDNHTRTVSNVRHLFSKHRGNLGVDGSVSYLFTKQGQIFLPEDLNLTELQLNNIMEIAINGGALDFDQQAGGVLIVTDPKNLMDLKYLLEKSVPALGSRIENAEIVMAANNYIKPDKREAAMKINTFLENLEDLDDVQVVHCNVDLSDLEINES